MLQYTLALIAGWFWVAVLSISYALPLPSGQEYFYHAPSTLPTVSASAALARPVGFGALAAGGTALDLRIALDTPDAPIDVYIVVMCSACGPGFWMIWPNGAIEPANMGIVPWRTNLSAALDEAVYPSLPAADLGRGSYVFWILVTPSGDFSKYYLWGTGFTLIPEPPCNAAIPAQLTAQGDYKAWRYATGISIGDVAISKRGWRAVGGGQDNNIYLFSREQAQPLFSYATGGQVNTVAISADGRAVVAGSGDGHIYLFECDIQTPAWSYDTGVDIGTGSAVVEGVSISPNGQWVGAVSRTHAYLFRRDSSTPVAKLDLSGHTDGAHLRTVAISGLAERWIVATGPGNTGSRLFYLGRPDIFSPQVELWNTTIPDLGLGPNDMATPIALSGDGLLMAAGGRDGQLRFWDEHSSVPEWNVLVDNALPVSSLAMSEDGKRLTFSAANELFYIDDSGSAPDLSSGNNWNWDGWLQSFDQPSVYTGHDSVPGQPTWLGVGGQLHAVDLSSDGNYLVAGDYVYGYAYSFYREFEQPIRLYHLQSTTDSVDPLDLSPDGSWMMMGSTGGELLRIEIAPVERIEVPVPIAYQIKDPTASEVANLIGGTTFDVDYWVLKPGRAATLSEEWEMWAYSGGVLIPPGIGLCNGSMSWSYTQALADGNQIVSGSRSLTPPQCLSSNISSIDAFFLVTDLNDQPSSKALAKDNALLANIQIGTGGP